MRPDAGSGWIGCVGLLAGLALATAAGCAPDLDGATGFTFRSARDVDYGVSSALLPLGIWSFATNVRGCGRSDCPTVVETDRGAIVQGGCVDGDGLAWRGTASFTEDEGFTEVLYDGWGYDGADGELWVDGHQLREVEDGLERVSTSWLSVEIAGDGPLGPDRVLMETDRVAVLSYREHEAVVDEVEATWAVDGAVDVGSRGAYELTGVGWFDEEEEAIWGDLQLRGFDSILLTLDGVDPDEECVAWTGSDGLSGEVCPAAE